MSLSENKKNELIVRVVGIDNWDRPVYVDKKGNFYKDVNLGTGKMDLCTSSNNEFYGEPEFSLKEKKIRVVKEFNERDINKYILEECAKFNLTEKITNREIEQFYKKIPAVLDKKDLSLKDIKIYLYNYIVDKMIRDKKITQQEGKKFMKQIEKKIKNKTQERGR